jgi:hypothetical protein
MRLALRGILLLSSRREIASGFGLCLPGRAVRLDDAQCMMLDATVLSVTGSSQRSPLHAVGSGRCLHFGKCALMRGTEGSNPSPSTGESIANLADSFATEARRLPAFERGNRIPRVQRKRMSDRKKAAAVSGWSRLAVGQRHRQRPDTQSHAPCRWVQ